ncbi:MAG: type II toxin-antitoxin system RelE/ParE family toxin [Firmicutes bacterium]|nr:type II toxin-antitoxin system RelE/ParE family toxin [Bacillota bacterium]
MDNYKVKINPRAVRDLDNIFAYIAFDKLSPQNARGQVERIKTSILSLRLFPYSHQEREEGRFANIGYRQIDNS